MTDRFFDPDFVSFAQASTHSPGDILSWIVRLWRGRYARLVCELDAELAGVALTCATLGAAKLMVRMQHGGTLACKDNFLVMPRIERLAERLADRFLLSCRDFFPCSHPEHDRQRYLRLPDPSLYQWTRLDIKQVALPYEEASLGRIWPHVTEIEGKILDYFATYRNAFQRNDEMFAYAGMSQLVAMMAASKWLLRAWGGGELAARFEWLADCASDSDYEKMCRTRASA